MEHVLSNNRQHIIILALFFAFAFAAPFYGPTSAMSFSLFASCIEIDKTFYHKIVDPDILDIGNSEYYAFVGVTCEGVPRKNAFSQCANNCPTFPDSYVKIDKRKKKICEGDTILVGSSPYPCVLGKMSKDKWPDN